MGTLFVRDTDDKELHGRSDRLSTRVVKHLIDQLAYAEYHDLQIAGIVVQTSGKVIPAPAASAESGRVPGVPVGPDSPYGPYPAGPESQFGSHTGYPNDPNQPFVTQPTQPVNVPVGADTTSPLVPPGRDAPPENVAPAAAKTTSRR